MRPPLLFIPLLVALALAATPGTAAAAGCAPSGSSLESLYNGVRVYSTTRDFGDGGSTTKTYVCSDRTGKRARLASSTRSPTAKRAGDFVGATRYAGRYFAAVVNTIGGLGGVSDAMIRRVDLTDGGQSRTDVCPRCNSRGFLRVTDMVLNTRGWIGWIARVRGGPDPTFYTVARRDSRGIALLDGGPDVEPRSLADSLTTLFWNAHGGPRNNDLY
jgi:hypothetical protein